jgi:HAD superfamily hydrolase (TIGR01484 family)
MRFQALASDYDGTIARDGVVDDQTIVALARLRDTGRKLIMVTGRELDDLIRVCPRLDLFDLVVAENGAVLYSPSDKLEAVLSGGPSLELVNRLKAVGVPNISVGRSIIALWKPHEVEALEAIRDLGLELHIVFNKDAVMVLPSAVNKATGLAEALKRLGLDVAGVVGVGDAENDHSFIKSCGYRVAVANAIPALKDEVDLVTEGARGEGVQQLIGRLIDAEDSLVSAKRGPPGGLSN